METGSTPPFRVGRATTSNRLLRRWAVPSPRTPYILSTWPPCEYDRGHNRHSCRSRCGSARTTYGDQPSDPLQFQVREHYCVEPVPSPAYGAPDVCSWAAPSSLASRTVSPKTGVTTAPDLASSSPGALAGVPAWPLPRTTSRALRPAPSPVVSSLSGSIRRSFRSSDVPVDRGVRRSAGLPAGARRTPGAHDGVQLALHPASTIRTRVGGVAAPRHCERSRPRGVPRLWPLGVAPRTSDLDRVDAPAGGCAHDTQVHEGT